MWYVTLVFFPDHYNDIRALRTTNPESLDQYGTDIGANAKKETRCAGLVSTA